MILLDYIANKGARIRAEGNSSPALWEQLRRAADQVGAEDIFPAGTQGPVLDDHIPFLEQAVPSIDLIDFCIRTPTRSRTPRTSSTRRSSTRWVRPWPSWSST